MTCSSKPYCLKIERDVEGDRAPNMQHLGRRNWEGQLLGPWVLPEALKGSFKSLFQARAGDGVSEGPSRVEKW